MSDIVLRPGVHVLDRGDGSSQIGIGPVSSVRIPGQSCDALKAALREQGTSHPLTQTLVSAGALDSASDRPRESDRAATAIHVRGLNRLGTALALLLYAAGYTQVRVWDDREVTLSDCEPWGPTHVDIGRRRDTTLAMMLEQTSRGALHRHRHGPRQAPALTIVVADQIADVPWVNPTACDELMAADLPHLVVALGTNQCATSHVIVPGKGPCLRCSFEAAVDRDPQWPLLCAQLAAKNTIDEADSMLVMNSALSVIAATDRYIVNGQLGNPGWTTTTWPTHEVQYHPWGPHPACGCTWDREL